MKKPNIIYFHSHDTGRYVQPYGYGIDTPNLQRLADEGVLLRNAFCAGPTCSPSRAALLSGQAPHSNGMMGLAHLGWRMNDYSQHLVHTLKAHGYTSVLCGVQHICCPPAGRVDEIGYDQVLSQEHDSKLIAARVADYISRPHDKPFFLSAGFFDTHRPFPDVSDAVDSGRVELPPPMSDTPQNRQDIAAFHTSAHRLDRALGQILDALDAAALTDNTLVICTTDHGLALPEMKCNLTAHGTGVMLILRGPGEFSGGSLCEALVSHIDLFPTLCDWLNIPAPEWLQGVSILPVLRGGTNEVNDVVFSEVTFHAAFQPMRSVRSKRWSYIRHFDREFPRRVWANIDDCPDKELRNSLQPRDESIPAEQFFDLAADPQERLNLAENPLYARPLEIMREKLNRWMIETDDLLLKEDWLVTLPPQAFGWTRSTYSPDDAQVHGLAALLS